PVRKRRGRFLDWSCSCGQVERSISRQSVLLEYRDILVCQTGTSYASGCDPGSDCTIPPGHDGEVVQSGSVHDVDAGLAARAAQDVAGDHLLAAANGAARPARHVRRHDEVRELVERQIRYRAVRVGWGRVAVPGVDHGARNAALLQGLEQRLLLD